MTQWELTTLFAYIDTGGRLSVNIDPSAVWTVKGKDGKTSWDKLVAMANEGWELVSVTPISASTSAAYTSYLLYTFKRPKS